MLEPIAKTKKKRSTRVAGEKSAEKKSREVKKKSRRPPPQALAVPSTPTNGPQRRSFLQPSLSEASDNVYMGSPMHHSSSFASPTQRPSFLYMATAEHGMRGLLQFGEAEVLSEATKALEYVFHWPKDQDIGSDDGDADHWGSFLGGAEDFEKFRKKLTPKETQRYSKIHDYQEDLHFSFDDRHRAYHQSYTWAGDQCPDVGQYEPLPCASPTYFVPDPMFYNTHPQAIVIRFDHLNIRVELVQNDEVVKSGKAILSECFGEELITATKWRDTVMLLFLQVIFDGVHPEPSAAINHVGESRASRRRRRRSMTSRRSQNLSENPNERTPHVVFMTTFPLCARSRSIVNTGSLNMDRVDDPLIGVELDTLINEAFKMSGFVHQCNTVIPISLGNFCAANLLTREEPVEDTQDSEDPGAPVEVPERPPHMCDASERILMAINYGNETKITVSQVFDQVEAVCFELSEDHDRFTLSNNTVVDQSFEFNAQVKDDNLNDNGLPIPGDALNGDGMATLLRMTIERILQSDAPTEVWCERSIGFEDILLLNVQDHIIDNYDDDEEFAFIESVQSLVHRCMPSSVNLENDKFQKLCSLIEEFSKILFVRGLKYLAQTIVRVTQVQIKHRPYFDPVTKVVVPVHIDLASTSGLFNTENIRTGEHFTKEDLEAVVLEKLQLYIDEYDTGIAIDDVDDSVSIYEYETSSDPDVDEISSFSESLDDVGGGTDDGGGMDDLQEQPVSDASSEEEFFVCRRIRVVPCDSASVGAAFFVNARALKTAVVDQDEIKRQAQLKKRLCNTRSRGELHQRQLIVSTLKNPDANPEYSRKSGYRSALSSLTPPDPHVINTDAFKNLDLQIKHKDIRCINTFVLDTIIPSIVPEVFDCTPYEK